MIIATNNQGKIKEIKEIFPKEKLYSLKEKNIDLEVEEDQETFIDNAIKKAKEVFKVADEPIIADDSGLCITALDDFPGVLTHRFLGEQATDRERNEYLIKKTSKHKNHEAKVICILAYYDGKNTIIGKGILKGRITDECRGKNGFGFDEIFEIKTGQTLAEMTMEEKNKISARAKAAKDLKKKLKKMMK